MFSELNRRVIFFYRKFDGGDVDENRHFIEGKWVAHCQKFKNCEQNINNFEIFHEFFMGEMWIKIQYFKNFDHKMAIFFSHITKFRKSHNIFFIWNIFVKNNNFWINLFGTIWWKIVRKMFVKINFETFQFSWKIYSGRYEKCLSK